MADSILDGNPHADKHGNKEVWSFVKGPARPAGSFTATGPLIPAGLHPGPLARARPPTPRDEAEAAKLAEQVTALLTGPRPGREKDPDRILYDNLVSLDGPLFRGLDLARLPKPRPGAGKYGLEKTAFGRHPLGKPADAEAASSVPANGVTEVRLPAALFRDREFVVEGRLDAGRRGSRRAVPVLTAPPAPATRLGRQEPRSWRRRAARPYKQLLQGFADFRHCFPQFICYPANHPRRRGRLPEDVPPRGRAAGAAVPRRRSRSAGSTASGTSIASSPSGR